MFGEKDCFIVAEMGASHCQRFERAVRLVLAANYAGADAVKVQMFDPDQMAKRGTMIKAGPWQGMELYELYCNTAMPYEWVPRLKTLAEGLGLFFFTTVYHPDTVRIAEDMGMEAYKIASFEITYNDLIDEVAQTKKPVIISTGMAEFTEIFQATRIVRKHHRHYYLLHCVSDYPADPKKMNLRTLLDMSRQHGGRVGLSDHSLSLTIPAVAATMGARIIEKHIRLNDDRGYDSGFSLNPKQFRDMVNGIREADKAMGGVSYGGPKKFRRKLINGKMLRG